MAPIPTSVKYVFWSFKTQQLKYMKEQAKETKNSTPEQILLIFSCYFETPLNMLSVVN